VTPAPRTPQGRWQPAWSPPRSSGGTALPPPPAPLPPPHEHCPTLPFLKPTGGNTPQLSPQHTADFLQTLQRLDPAAAALLENIFDFEG